MAFPFDAIANSLLKHKADYEYDGLIERREIYCEKCGTSLSYFLDTGFVGCANCYDRFMPYALRMAEEIHGKARHVGKVPRVETTKAAKRRELERLIKEKEIAVQQENYMLAEELKYQIESLRRELK